MGRRESLVFIKPEKRFDAFIQYCDALQTADPSFYSWGGLVPLTIVIMKAELPYYPDVKAGSKILWVVGYSGFMNSQNLLIPDYIPELGDFSLEFRSTDQLLGAYYPIGEYLDGINLNDDSATAFSENEYFCRYSIKSYIRSLQSPLNIKIGEERVATIKAMRDELIMQRRY